MGRYYSGNIEGKFWFGVQNSDDGEYFGAVSCYDDGHEIGYVITNEKKHLVQKGIDTCLELLGKYKSTLDVLFEGSSLYNKKQIKECFEKEHKEVVSEESVLTYLQLYARLGMGRKIEKWFLDNPESDCYFLAEL